MGSLFSELRQSSLVAQHLLLGFRRAWFHRAEPFPAVLVSNVEAGSTFGDRDCGTKERGMGAFACGPVASEFRRLSRRRRIPRSCLLGWTVLCVCGCCCCTVCGSGRKEETGRRSA